MSRLERFGISIRVPRGWEGRIFKPDLPPPAINMAILHLTSGVLTQERSSFAPELAAQNGAAGLLASLVEFEPKLANEGLYGPRGIPRTVSLGELSPRALQVPNDAQAGRQWFFSTKGRAFCLYVVAGLGAGAEERVTKLNRALESLEVSRR